MKVLFAGRLSAAALPLAALLLSLWAPSARAGNDEPIPYPDEEPTQRKLPRRSDIPGRMPVETEVEKQDREVSLARLDDPNTGIGVEALGGAMLIESSRGQWVEPRAGVGARLTWEFGRLFPDEDIHEALFADVTWAFASLHDGTAQIFADTTYHYFTLAPAYTLRLGGSRSAFGLFGQLGGGVAYESAVVHSGTGGAVQTPVAGIKPLIQYGVGLRGDPRLWQDAPFRLSFRLEVTRLHRGYMDDTFVGGSLGVTF